MFYTIEDQDRNLIVIDGGHDNEAEVADLRYVISLHDNHVKTWILTHPHPDHVGAFNNIVANPQGITIDEIYTIEVHDERYRETAKGYDDIDVYNTWLERLKTVEETGTAIHYVYEGDTFESLGMEFDVLHTWDDSVDVWENNLMNNGSMVFLAKGQEEEFLFLSDGENEIENDLLARHEDVIANAEYIQLGHHGNWGMTTEFYEHTNPKMVFMDAADFLFQPSDDHDYDAPVMRDYFLNRGVEVHMYSDAPTSVVVK